MSKINFLILITTLLSLIFSCTDSTSGGETLNEKVALYMPDGITPAVDAIVQFYEIGDTSAAPDYQTQTDENGRYSIEGVTTGNGYYNVIASYSDSLYSMQDTVYITSESHHVRDDTLNNPGSISGVVALQPNHSHLLDNVYVIALGMGRAVNVDSTGWFTLPKLAPGDYDLQVDTDIENYGPRFVNTAISAGINDTIADTITLPFSGIPVVTGLVTAYDTLNGVVNLKWNKSSYGDVASYLIFRKDSDSLYFMDTPKDWTSSTDTIYYDTIYSKFITDSAIYEYDYSIVILNNATNSGAKYSYKSILTVPPSMVKTNISLDIFQKSTGIQVDSLEKNDTAKIIADFSNPARCYTKVSWALEHPDSIIEIKYLDSTKTFGSDTLIKSWDREGYSKIYVLIEDFGETIWTDSIDIYLWKFPISVQSYIDSVNYTSAYLRWNMNHDIDFKSYNINYCLSTDSIIDSFPNTTILNQTDTTFTVTGLIPATQYDFRVDVLDSAGFLSKGVMQQGITFAPPTIININDTTTNIYDTLTLKSSATDANSQISRFYWQIDSIGFDSLYTDSIITLTYNTSGKKTVYVKAINYQGIESAIDTVLIDVSLGAPVISPHADTVVSQTMSCLINVTAMDTNSSGSIETYYWDIDNGGWDDSTDNPTNMFAKPEGGIMTVIWGVRDDDCVISTDTFNILFNRKPTSISISTPSLSNAWINFNHLTSQGDLPIVFNVVDPDGISDILTYNYWESTDSLNWILKYNGQNIEYLSTSLNVESKYFWKLEVKDLYGDNLVNVGSFITPSFQVKPPVGMNFIPAQHYSFNMGDLSFNNAIPHTVNFTYDFFIDKTEITQGNYDSIMRNPVYGYTGYISPSWGASGTLGMYNYGVGPKFPAYHVNWYDAVLYCNARSKVAGMDTVYSYSSILGIPGNNCELGNLYVDLSMNGFRLPTEAEWEYACRAGTNTFHYWDNWSNNKNNYTWNSDNSESSTHEVASKLPNSFGLYDMNGNLNEWCNDLYGEYSNYSVTDPSGPLVGSSRIKRGGAFNSSAYMGSAHRMPYNPKYETWDLGFRTVLTIK